MTIPTQDPEYTALRLIRKAKEKNKPLRYFIGVNAKGGKSRLLVAVDDASNLVKQAPREELTVHPDASPMILAAALQAVWTRLQPQIATSYPTRGPKWNGGYRHAG